MTGDTGSIGERAGRGRLFVIAAPAGAGKTSRVRALLEREPSRGFSVSYTTRARRPTETHGRDYFFVTGEEFESMAARGEFLEHARVFDNRYGTARGQVESALAAGRNLILEIDWQGARQVRRAMPECVSIFILPPSRAELERRLRGRGTDAEEVIQRRLHDAASDMTQAMQAGIRQADGSVKVEPVPSRSIGTKTTPLGTIKEIVGKAAAPISGLK